MNIKETIAIAKDFFTGKKKKTLDLAKDKEIVKSCTHSLNYTIANLTEFEMNLIVQSQRRFVFFRKSLPKKIIKLAAEEKYPTDLVFLKHLSKEFVKDLSLVDVIPTPKKRSQKQLLLRANKDLIFFDKNTLRPWVYSYDEVLENKKVLIITPFSELFKVQYIKRKNIHTNNSLPDCKIVFIDPTILENKTSTDDYFEVLDKLKVEILKLDFDIALFGETKYELPLSHFVASLNKSVMMLGNNIFYLFGLYTTNKNIDKLPINDFWLNIDEYNNNTNEQFAFFEGENYETKFTRRKKRK